MTVDNGTAKNKTAVPLFLGDKMSDSEQDTILDLQQKVSALEQELSEYRENNKVVARSNSHLFRTLMDQSHDSIFVIDPDTSKFLEINQTAARRLGYSYEELLALQVFDISMNVRDHNQWRKHVAKIREQGSILFETEQICKDGSCLPVEVNVKVIMVDGCEYLVAVARDITSRKKAAEELAAEKNKLEAVVAALGDGLTLQDRNYKVLYQNNIHKFRQGEHVGEYCYHAYQQKDSVCKGCLLKLCFQDGKVHRREVAGLDKNGNTIYMEVSASPVRDLQGNIYAGIETVRDITARKQLENELAKKDKIESIGQLAGGLAHDFNNLLTAIVGNISLAKAYLPLDSESREILTDSENACARALSLTKQLLTFSKGGAPVVSTVSIAGLIAESAQFSLRGSNIKLVCDIPDNLGPVDVDPGQISQVVENLVLNAAQAMFRAGTVTVSAVQISLDGSESFGLERGDYLLISVKDTGPGIPVDIQGRIFEPYFTTKETGNGLGLAICYSIINHHNGMLTFDSQKDKGTTFLMYLPVSEKRELTPLKKKIRRQILQEETQSTPARVLLMDDEAFIQHVSAKLLKFCGYRYELVSDGRQAVKMFAQAILEKDPFDVVILDLTIPGGMGGRETIGELLELDANVKVIVSSGYSNDPIMAKPKAYGFSGVLAKPFMLEDMRDVITEVLYGSVE